MNLFKVDHIKSNGGKKSMPAITFKLTGVISLTAVLIKEVCPEALETNDDYYLHLFTDENPKSNSEIGIVIDKNESQGLKIRWDKANTGRENANICISAKQVVTAMAKEFDWPLGKDKKPAIKYVLDDKSVLSDKTPIYILR